MCVSIAPSNSEEFGIFFFIFTRPPVKHYVLGIQLDLNGLNNKLTIVFKPYSMDMLLKKELYGEKKIHFKEVIDPVIDPKSLRLVLRLISFCFYFVSTRNSQFSVYNLDVIKLKLFFS